MRILLTGGAGYIGSHSLLTLLRAGHELCVSDTFANSDPEVLRRVAALSGRSFRSETTDVCDSAAMTALLRDFRPETVVHFAGLKAVGEAEADPLAYYRTNVGGTLALLAAMDAADCRRIVFSSSATVYGDPAYLPYDEAHPCAPTNVYGRSKLMAEQVIGDWCRATPGTAAVLLRYFNPVGADASGRIGEDPQGVPNNLMPFIAQVAVGRRPALGIFGTDYDTRDGTGERDYLHVSDLARAHEAAVHYAQNHPGCEVFNLGTGRGVTVREMLAAFSEACGRSLPYEELPRRAGDLPAYYADPRRAEQLLHWRATLGLAEICQSAWVWQSGNPQGYRR